MSINSKNLLNTTYVFLIKRVIRIYSFTWLIRNRIKMKHFRKFAWLTKLFVFRKGKGGNPAPTPYLVTSSSEEVHFRRDKSNDNPTYKEIIIENQVGNRIDHWIGDHWNQVGNRIDHLFLVKEIEELNPDLFLNNNMTEITSRHWMDIGYRNG